MFNDTHREKLCYTQFSTRMAAWLLLMFTQSIKLYKLPYFLLKSTDSVKNVIHQIGSKNKWLLLSASFTRNLGWFLY